MKGNKSRRSVANDRINKFLNNKSVGIKAVRISEAGNIEIKFIAWHLSSAQLKLRVNLTTLTFTFEQYGTRNQQGIRNVATKRKAIDTAINGDKNFFETEMLAFLEANMLSCIKTDNERFKEMYMSRWDVLKPEPLPDKEKVQLVDCAELPHVRYAADSLAGTLNKCSALGGSWAISDYASSSEPNKSTLAEQLDKVMHGRRAEDILPVADSQKLEAAKNQRRYEVIKAIHDKGSTVSGFQLEAEKQYAALMRDRDGTYLFDDDQFDEMFNNASQKYNMLPSELNASFPDLAIIEEQTTKGDIDYFVTASNLIDEQVANLLNVVENPPTKLRQIMDNISADGKVTINIDIENDNIINVDKDE